MKTARIFILPALLALVSCGGGTPSAQGGKDPSASDKGNVTDQPSLHPFPSMTIPMVYADDQDASREYALEHYWDNFFAQGGPTTPNAILGVSDGDVEQALANYIGALAAVKTFATPDNPEPLRQAQKSMRTFFGKLERHQLADTTSKVYLRLTEKVSSYLFDPNSPLRDEDLYLPFVEAMAGSPCTSEDMRAAYRFEASQCRINQFGQKAPDFRYSTAGGTKGTLYAVKADYTMLFFSNPGCTACKEIIGEIRSRTCIEDYIRNGRLAIVNIYIDEEVAKWREYLPNYPSSWINGYDYTFQLRESGKYAIRAIPSLYLLDSSKRIIMKDAATESVLSYLDQI